MIFSEIYGSYFSVVADILRKAVHGNLTEKDLFEIVRKKGFGESTLNIPEKLKRAEWPLITEDYKTPHPARTGHASDHFGKTMDESDFD